MSLRYRLLDDPLIRYRNIDGQQHHVTLPELLAAFSRDAVRDFPGLRPHQRHPWHAFLVQLAAIALHAAKRADTSMSTGEWRGALLALTPDDPDGAAYALVTPDDRPAFLQAPCKSGESRTWKKRLATPDALDMLITSKNHDLKAARMMLASPEDWIYALVSLQTQEGFLGAGKYGISRMNGGFASRSAFGVVPTGHWGRRWARDTQLLLKARDNVVGEIGLKAKDGVALVWLRAWDGLSSLSFDTLDPFYIEVCRRIRLEEKDGTLIAFATTSKVERIAAKERLGMTGDAWTPVAVVESKALSITARGFDYKLLSTLAFSGDFKPTIARTLREEDGEEGLVLLAQGVARSKGKTEGYHERRIPVSLKMRGILLAKHTNQLEAAAQERILAIGDVRKVLWSALCALFANGETSATDDIKKKASEFSKPFEAGEDSRFFDDLIVEFDAAQAGDARDQWLIELVDRAEQVLTRAFDVGPRANLQRYRARSRALGRFRSGLRSEKSTLARIDRVLKDRANAREAAREALWNEV